MYVSPLMTFLITFPLSACLRFALGFPVDYPGLAETLLPEGKRSVVSLLLVCVCVLAFHAFPPCGAALLDFQPCHCPLSLGPAVSLRSAAGLFRGVVRGRVELPTSTLSV